MRKEIGNAIGVVIAQQHKVLPTGKIDQVLRRVAKAVGFAHEGQQHRTDAVEDEEVLDAILIPIYIRILRGIEPAHQWKFERPVVFYDRKIEALGILGDKQCRQ